MTEILSKYIFIGKMELNAFETTKWVHRGRIVAEKKGQKRKMRKRPVN